MRKGKSCCSFISHKVTSIRWCPFSADCHDAVLNHSYDLLCDCCWLLAKNDDCFKAAPCSDRYWAYVIGLASGCSTQPGHWYHFRKCLSCKAVVLARKATESPIRLGSSEILHDSEIQLVQESSCLSYIVQLAWNYWPSRSCLKSSNWGATAKDNQGIKVRMPAVTKHYWANMRYSITFRY